MLFSREPYKNARSISRCRQFRMDIPQESIFITAAKYPRPHENTFDIPRKFRSRLTLPRVPSGITSRTNCPRERSLFVYAFGSLALPLKWRIQYS